MSDKLKVYVESSFVCYLTGDQTANAKISADQAYTRQWWEEEKSACDMYISKYVIGECAVGRADAVAKRDSILKLLSVIDADPAKVGELAQKLMDMNFDTLLADDYLLISNYVKNMKKSY